MSKDYESLLDYKKSLKDWHYDPSVPSNDAVYIGRITNLDFSSIKLKLNPYQASENGIKLYEDDFKNGKLIPSQLNPDSVGAMKLDHIRHGYNKHNSRYTQWIDNRDDLPDDFDSIKNLCSLKDATIACFKQDPGNTNPWHFDTYQGAVEKGNLTDKERKNVKRYLLFLENWDWGHFLQVGNSVLTHWKAGDMYTWDYGMYHLSTNGGVTPKWTCQVTGYPTEKSLHNLKEFEFKIRKA